MKILGITLARGGSKSIPKKNIKNINGFPLIYYTVSEALKSKYITDYIVSTDSDEIAEVAKYYGASVPFIRPEEFSSDTASSSSALLHALDFMEESNNLKYDYIVELMCTNPLKTFEDIDSCILKIIETKADSVIAMHRIFDQHPARVKKIIDDKIVDFCVTEIPESRRQDLAPDAFIRSGSIYCLNRDYFKETNQRYGSSNSRPYILPPERAINIDEEIDFRMAEIIISEKT